MISFLVGTLIGLLVGSIVGAAVLHALQKRGKINLLQVYEDKIKFLEMITSKMEIGFMKDMELSEARYKKAGDESDGNPRT